MKLETAMESLRLKFTSANSMPVSRATITRDEYEAIKEAIEQPIPYEITARGRELLKGRE